MNGTCDNYGSDAPGAFEQGIDLPPTFDEILALNHKPTAQVQSELLLAAGLGPLLGPDQARNYINFYAYMHKVVDEHIGSVLDAIEATPQMLDDTVIVRMSDHGGDGDEPRRFAAESVQRLRGNTARSTGHQQPLAVSRTRSHRRPGVVDRRDAHSRHARPSACASIVELPGYRSDTGHRRRCRLSAKSQRAGSGHDSVHLRRSELCDARRSEHRHAAQTTFGAYARVAGSTRCTSILRELLRRNTNCTTYKPTPWN